MTNTEFIVREKSGVENPLLKSTATQLRLLDGALILGILTTFVGLLLLLSK